MGWKIARRRAELVKNAGKLDALSPLATLRRGFAVALSAEAKVLRGVADLPAGRPVELRLADGRVACRSEGPITPSEGAV
jgi:exodeoxyribonuclease VII large subunit